MVTVIQPEGLQDMSPSFKHNDPGFLLLALFPSMHTRHISGPADTAGHCVAIAQLPRREAHFSAAFSSSFKRGCKRLFGCLEAREANDLPIYDLQKGWQQLAHGTDKHGTRDSFPGMRKEKVPPPSSLLSCVGCREQVRPQDRGMDNEERAAAPAPHRGPEELAAAPVPAIGHGHTL